MKKRDFFGIRRGVWRHASDLRIPARQVRFHVSRFNNEFGTDEDHQDYIVSGRLGYRITSDIDEIEEAIDRDMENATSRLSEIRERKRHLNWLKKQKLYGRIK